MQFQDIVGASCWTHLTAESWTPGSVGNPGTFRGCSCGQASVLSHWLVAESRSPFLNLLGLSFLTEKTGYLQLLRHGIMRGFTSGSTQFIVSKVCGALCHVLEIEQRAKSISVRLGRHMSIC